MTEGPACPADAVSAETPLPPASAPMPMPMPMPTPDGCAAPAAVADSQVTAPGAAAAGEAPDAAAPPSGVRWLDALNLALRGRLLIEASAGTGKTWTLAALYVRLVLGHAPGRPEPGPGLMPPQILVMTFTEAATAELRERIRQRLAEAARCLRGTDEPVADDFLRALRAQMAPGCWPQCALRLDLAAQWMDEAAIHTIHGWCHRMLRSHAFDSASLFDQQRVQDAERLQLQALQAYWRRWLYALEAPELQALGLAGLAPPDLLEKLRPLWNLADRAPAPPDAPSAPPDSPEVLLARWRPWQQQERRLQAAARAAWTPELVQALQDAAAARRLRGVRSDYFARWMAQMAAWVQGGPLAEKTLAQFTVDALRDVRRWSELDRWPGLAALQAWHEHLAKAPDLAAGLKAHAAHAVAAELARARAREAQFDFADLLKNLYHAVQAPNGQLAGVIARQYPVALVDEFQDTDPWQFGILEKIYSFQPIQDEGLEAFSSEAAPPGALVLIGDPKQAIYSFRGADLATYLRARRWVDAIYTLQHNHRSTPALVAAVNQMFGAAQAPFGELPFVPAAPGPGDRPPLVVAGQPQPAVTVWHRPWDEPPRLADWKAAMAEVFASQMVALLQTGAARSADMAVLVRERSEAAAMRRALDARGVRSVYLSERNSVYASPQAWDLWRILRAVAAPGDQRLVRAALASATWSLDLAELENLLCDEAAWERQVEHFMRWQQVWRSQGVLPMLHRVLHDQGLAGRLLNGSGRAAGAGERALTNLLHLGELLQAASLALPGEAALIRYLEEQLRRPAASAETAQLRLESDAERVQIITLHKSKGLQYPLVFLPFAALFKAEPDKGLRPDAERLSEDIRLLYVGLTRAQRALWLGAANVRGDLDGRQPRLRSALSALLGRSRPDDLRERLQAWAGQHIVVADAPQPNPAVWQPPQAPTVWRGACVPQRQLTRQGWIASFSALVRPLSAASPDAVAEAGPRHPAPAAELSDRDLRWQDAQLDERTPAAGEPGERTASLEPFTPLVTARPTDPAPYAWPVWQTVAGPAGPEPDAGLADAPWLYNAFPAGSRYGTLLHELLQWQAERGWPLARGASQPATPSQVALASLPAAAGPLPPDAAWQALLTRRCQSLGLTPAQRDLLGRWLVQIVQSKLPLSLINKAENAPDSGIAPCNDFCLGGCSAADFWPEMAFSLPVARLDSARIDNVVSRHLWPGQPRSPLPQRRLHGMLTGFMDAVLQHQGRYYVLDYKTNLLSDYASAALQHAMLAHRYDLQAALYGLALHRLLRARLPGYTPERHLGGALYWFVRGIRSPCGGLLGVPLCADLLHTLDQTARTGDLEPDP